MLWLCVCVCPGLRNIINREEEKRRKGEDDDDVQSEKYIRRISPRFFSIISIYIYSLPCFMGKVWFKLVSLFLSLSLDSPSPSCSLSFVVVVLLLHLFMRWIYKHKEQRQQLASLRETAASPFHPWRWMVASKWKEKEITEKDSSKKEKVVEKSGNI